MTDTVLGQHVEVESQEGNRRTRAATPVRLPEGTEVRTHGHTSRRRVDVNQPKTGPKYRGFARTSARGSRSDSAPRPATRGVAGRAVFLLRRRGVDVAAGERAG
ncbi:dsRBD fold-containing protein [Streptomyces sp. NPDC002588]|uniref:dsRBD fold-containing protein n=1 Tax=Streptomyces sp. NPDC002588 TaxID=3154419 RepID=UPI0033279A86